jgi:hypothetical protein
MIINTNISWELRLYKLVSTLITNQKFSCFIYTNTGGKNLQKYNMFVAQIGCAALGVLALSLFGPGWLARGAALSACIAFMTITGATHPPGKTPMRNMQFGCVVFHLCFPELLFYLLLMSGSCSCKLAPLIY